MKNISILFIGITSVVYLSGCAAQLSQSQTIKQPQPVKIITYKEYTAKTEEAYERAGHDWGEILREKGFKPENDPDDDFVEFLVSGRRSGYSSDPGLKRYESYYFTVHSSLKKAFQEGFRKGYEDRKADLILGPHIEKVAGIIAELNGKYFGEDVEAYVGYQNDYLDKFKKSHDKSVAIFMELIAEGSPADRENFKTKFIVSYKVNVENYLTKSEYYLKQRQNSEYISLDFSKKQDDFNKEQNSKAHEHNPEIKLYKSKFSILLAGEMWELLYKDSLYKVGKEMGQKLAHNLIPRPELLEWLRRTRSALSSGNIESELEIIKKGFEETYGKTGGEVFNSMVNDI